MLCVTSIKTQAEFDEFDAILADFYGEKHDREIGLGWWLTYPQGAIVIKSEGVIIGGLTLYPIQAAQFAGFIQGQLTELALEVDPAIHQHWNISDYILNKEHRNITNLMTLVWGALDHWYQYQSGYYPIQVSSIPSTRSGEKASSGLKLKPFLERGADGFPIYFMQIANPIGLHYYIFSMRLRVCLIQLKYGLAALIKPKKQVTTRATQI